MKIKWKPLLICIAIPLIVGGISAFITMGAMEDFSEFNQPPLSPPGWLFPVVWIILYTLMGISAAMIFLRRGDGPKEAKDALAVYSMSLAVNFVWCILFFSLRIFLVSFVWLLLLLGLIIATIIRFKPIDPRAAYLQIPYALWVAFAGYLNLAIFFLNK